MPNGTHGGMKEMGFKILTSRSPQLGTFHSSIRINENFVRRPIDYNYI